MNELRINHLAVLVSIVLQFVIGFLWYGPLFGEAWMGMVGLSMEIIEADPAGAGEWFTNIIASAAGIYLLAWLFVRLGVRTALRGAWLGFLIGFVFVLLSNMTTGMFAKDPYGLAWITGGFTTVGLMVGGLVLGGWTKTAPPS
jgi:hypothetical protein